MTVSAVRLSGQPSQWIFSSGGVSQEATKIDKIALGDRSPLQNEEGKIAELAGSAEQPPSAIAIHYATSYLRSIFNQAIRLGSWSPPHITLSEASEIVFEWWHKDKKITLYFSNGQPEFIKVWGTDIDTEMDSGVLADDGWALTTLLLWLNS